MRVRVRWILRREVRRHARQSRRMRREILERDRPSIAFRDLCAGRQELAIESVSETSPRCTMSASTSDVKTFVTDRISNTVSAARRRSSPREVAGVTIRRPFGSRTPTTIPTLCLSASIRLTRMLRISESAEILCGRRWRLARVC